MQNDFCFLSLYQIKIITGVVCFSFFIWLRVLDKAEYSAFESTLNSPIVSYRTSSLGWCKGVLCQLLCIVSVLLTTFVAKRHV